MTPAALSSLPFPLTALFGGLFALLSTVFCALVLMAVIELNGAEDWMLWAIGALLVGGQLLHFYGLDPNKGATAGRVAGIGANLIAIVGGGVVAILRFHSAA